MLFMTCMLNFGLRLRNSNREGSKKVRSPSKMAESNPLHVYKGASPHRFSVTFPLKFHWRGPSSRGADSERVIPWPWANLLENGPSDPGHPPRVMSIQIRWTKYYTVFQGTERPTALTLPMTTNSRVVTHCIARGEKSKCRPSLR